MTFYVESETACELPFDAEEIGTRVAEAVLRSEGCPFGAGLCLLLTDDEGIRRLNRQHRKQDAPTDVLSFPALLFSEPAGFASAGWDAPGVSDPETGEVWLGDIAVNVARVYEQAEAYGHGPVREFAFLIAHSVLHLIGYDHAEAEAASEMEERQERVLQQLGYTRD